MTKRGSSSLALTVEPRCYVRLEARPEGGGTTPFVPAWDVSVRTRYEKITCQLVNLMMEGIDSVNELSSMTPVVLEFLFPPPAPPIA